METQINTVYDLKDDDAPELNGLKSEILNLSKEERIALLNMWNQKGA